MNSVSKAFAHCRQHNPGLKIIGLLKNYSTTSTSNEIIIPKRIPRSPTDILKALSETIKRDPTAPDFKYQDDPYLTPVSAPQKRTYILSYESGRKAARWVRDEHPELFQQIIADPPIEAFKPRQKITEQTPLCEKMLLEMIDKVYVKNAIQVFENLANSGEKISEETLQSLLEFVSYYNCEEPIPEDEMEERWFAKQEQFRHFNQWNGEIPQKIFQLIEAPGTAAYSALITGMLRYGEVFRVEELIEECKVAGIPLDIKVYNQLILSTRTRFGVFEKRWDQITTYLKRMKEENIAPNVQIFNSILEAVVGGNVSRKKVICVFRTLGEMRALNIKLSLATYKNVLYALQQGGFRENSILKDILNEIGDEPLEVVDKRDIQFFVQAMNACHQIYKDPALAKKVDDLLNKNGHNKSLIGSSISESIYYRSYILLLCETAPMEKVFEIYNTLVPNIYSPEPTVIAELLKVVKKNKRPEFVEDIFEYIQSANQTGQQQLVETLLETCVEVGGGKNKEKYATSFANMADQVMDMLSNPSTMNFSGRLILTETLAGAALVLVARAKRVKDVQILIDLYQTNSSGNMIDAKYLSELADIGIEMKDPDIVLWVIQLASTTSTIPVRGIIAKLCRKMELPPQVDMVVAQIVGTETLKKIKEKNPVGLPEESDSGSSSSSSSCSSSSSESDGEVDSDDEIGIKK